MMKKILVAFTLTATLTVLTSMSALAGNATSSEPPAGAYKQVSTLVPLLKFIPGLGSLYVDPATLPAGPFAAYDKTGKLVSSIYMIPIADMQGEKPFNGLAVAGDAVHSVDMYYNAGHPGVDVPHYHVTVWHVDPRIADLK